MVRAIFCSRFMGYLISGLIAIAALLAWFQFKNDRAPLQSTDRRGK